MKHLVLIFLCLFLPLSVSSKVDNSIRTDDKLVVKSIEPSNGIVKVGNNKIKVNQTISAASVLNWGKGVKYVKVYNKRTNTYIIFNSSDYSNGKESLYHYVKRNQTSSLSSPPPQKNKSKRCQGKLDGSAQKK